MIINDGVIDQIEMGKQNYNIDDLFTQLREKDIKDISTIRYLILETSGNISIIRKEDNILFPYPFIKDGEVDYDSLKLYKKDIDWLNKEINCIDVKEIFIALLRKDGMYIVRRK